MIEQIEWHAYPDNKPTVDYFKLYLITRMKSGDNFPLCEYRIWEKDKWGESEELMQMTFPDSEYPVVAFSDFPKGWNRDELNRVIADENMKEQIVLYANKLREMFIDENASLDTNNGLCAAWLLLKKYFPDLVKRFDKETEGPK